MKIVFALLVGLFAVAAQAGSVDMTCAEAKATYNANGRIYVRTNGNDIVPIWGLVKSCPNGYDKNPYWVRATDNKTCVLGYTCVDRN